MGLIRWVGGGSQGRGVVRLCACVALLTSLGPLLRIGQRGEISYNEGWNVYNAQAMTRGAMLYPSSFGWTMVNYPMLSFIVSAQLHKLTHDYLYTARVLSFVSLLVSCALVGTIASTLGASRRAGWLAGLFTLGVFCTDASVYVGQDDPQLLAQVFFLAGLQVYLLRRGEWAGLAAAALLIVVGGSIKHNPVDVPLVIFLDLLFVSRRRSLWFAGCLAFLVWIDVQLHLRYGGPAFVQELVAPRRYDVVKSLDQLLIVIGPVLIPFAAAVYTLLRLVHGETRRRLALLLGCALLIGAYFGGGQGVSINALFSSLLAMCVLLGLFFDRMLALDTKGSAYAVLSLFVSLAIPMIVSRVGDPQANPLRTLPGYSRSHGSFEREVQMLRERPGPALCESLLSCYDAGKPYVYDPFNATRMIEFGRLDPRPVIEALQQQRYAAVQLDGGLDRAEVGDRFAPEILHAIQQNYEPLLLEKDVAVYVPKSRAAGDASRDAR